MTDRAINVSSRAVAAVVVVLLLARSIAYAIAPTSAARMLEHRAGGPALPVLTLVALALAVARGRDLLAGCFRCARTCAARTSRARRSAASIPPCAHACAGVRSRQSRRLQAGLFEAYLHWRAGLGWHGIACVFGPVHRDLLPIATALSFVAAALFAAAEHVVAWMRRTFSLLRRLPPRVLRVAAFLDPLVDAPSAVWRVGSVRPRAPPAFS